MKKTIFRYTIQGYDRMKTNGQCLNVCDININATNGNEALAKAKKLVKKKNYRVAQVQELTERG